MPARSHGKKKLEKPNAKPIRKKDAGTAKQDNVAKRKLVCPASRLQLAVCVAVALGAAGACWMWMVLLPSKVDLRPKPMLVLPHGGQVASSFTASSAPGVPGCTVERGYANRHIVGPERFGVSSPKECMNFCRESDCNCWSWKDDGFCRTGKAQTCTYIASEDDDRWMYGSCQGPPPQPAPAAAAATPFNPIVAQQMVPANRQTSEATGSKGVSQAAPATAVLAEPAGSQTEGASKADAVAVPTPDASVCPVLMITHKRANYLKRALASLFSHRKRPQTHPIIASQDGDDADVKDVLQKHEAKGELTYLRFAPQTFLPSGYKRLTAHYAWAFAQVFEVLGFHQTIVLEEDLEIAVDFFSYFEATLPLLRSDPQLFCVSAWNDNGRSDLVMNHTAIYRSDFFPGLGWMLLSRFWKEVRSKWPKEYWDDFLRRPDIRLERQCLRPEVSRTHTFGEQGVSRGQFYKKHLASNLLNDQAVDWSSMNLSHVATAPAFDLFLSQQVKAAKLLRLEDLAKGNALNSSIAIRYADTEWKKVAQHFGLMEDEKAGIRRGSYRGVLPFAWSGQPAYLVRDWPLN